MSSFVAAVVLTITPGHFPNSSTQETSDHRKTYCTCPSMLTRPLVAAVFRKEISLLTVYAPQKDRGSLSAEDLLLLLAADNDWRRTPPVHHLQTNQRTLSFIVEVSQSRTMSSSFLRHVHH